MRYVIDIADDVYPFSATVTTSRGWVVNVSSSSSAYEAARAGLATAWLMEGGYAQAKNTGCDRCGFADRAEGSELCGPCAEPIIPAIAHELADAEYRMGDA